MLDGLVRAARQVDERTPDDRDRYADLLRVVAIAMVVVGHWLAAVVLVDDERLAVGQLLAVVPETRWGTWLFQVMPLFFLVGGQVNAGSWTRARARDEGHWLWVRRRARRLLGPAVPLLVLWLVLAPGLALLGVEEGWTELTSEVAFMPLWFLVVYLLTIVLVPWTWWLHRRAAGVVLVGLVAMIGLIDVLDRAEVPVVGYANYLLVFGGIHQLGYLWFEERLPRGAVRGLLVALASAAALAALVVVGGYPVSMVGVQAAAQSNATPPTLALVALGLAQLGVVVTLRPRAERWLARPVPWWVVITAGSVIMTVFLWHMTAMVVAGVLTHPTGLWPDVTAVDARWWALRPVWLLACAAVLAVLVPALQPFERVEEPTRGGLVRTVGGVVATCLGLFLILTEGLYDPQRATGLPLMAVGVLLVGLAALGAHRNALRT